MALLIPLIVLALMWVLLILPQQRRVKEHRSFVAGLEVGDEVVTTSGIHGTIVDLDDATTRLRIAPDVVITVARMAIGHAQPREDERVGERATAASADDEAPADTDDSSE